MEKYGFVYIWYDRKHKRYYIGAHWGHENDGYVCSSSWMKKAYKNRPEDFKRKILKKHILSRHNMFLEEQKWLDMIKPEEIKKRYYNLNTKNNNIWHKYDGNIKTISQKISQKTKEAMNDPKVREKYLAGLKKRDNRSSDLEVREKRRQSMKAAMAKKFPSENKRVASKFGSDEYRSNMAESSRKRWQSMSENKKEEIRRKISETNKRSNVNRSGMLWWNNGHINTRSKVQPGHEWIRGKLK